LIPLTVNDLLIWITVTAVILTATIALINPSYGKLKLKINKNRIRAVMYLVGIIYCILISVKIFEIITQ
jgi:hypothetical protein